MEAKWSLLSVVFYVFLAYVGAFSIHKIKIHEINTCYKKNKHIWCTLWMVIWVFFSTFRLINEKGVGGSDAYYYLTFFENCFDSSIINIHPFVHYGKMWLFMCRAIRIFTGNYHFFLLLYNVFLVYTYQLFIMEFLPDRFNVGPLILVFFIYLRGFNTFRTNVAVAMILLAIVSYKKGKGGLTCLFVVVSISIQVASALYGLFFIFYHVYENKKLSIYKCLQFLILSIVIAPIARTFFIRYLGDYLGHAYSAYAKKMVGVSFFNNFWKIVIGQLILGFILWITRKQIKKLIEDKDNPYHKELKIIWRICMFDLFIIPFVFVLNIWRGYEYFYIPRLLMWSQVIPIIGNKLRIDVKINNLLSVVLFTFWLIWRINNTWEASKYLPYVLHL